MLLDYSVGTGDLTGLCQAGSVIGFWVPTAHHSFPRILTLFAFVSAMSNVTPFPFFGVFTFLGERLGNGPSHTWQDIRHRKTC